MGYLLCQSAYPLWELNQARLFYFRMHPCIWGKVYATTPVKRIIYKAEPLNGSIAEKKIKKSTRSDRAHLKNGVTTVLNFTIHVH